MTITEAAVRDALSTVNDPDLKRPLTELNMVKDIIICGGNVKVTLMLTTAACPLKDAIKNDAKSAVQQLDGIENVEVDIAGETLPAFSPKREATSGIKNIIAVSSGKGGVGKTTVTVNLAAALAQTGAKVGVLDADIYGPNVPIMMGLQGAKITGQTPEGKLMVPEAHGVKVMSMAFLLKDDQPVVWRGPMLDKVIRQFLTDSDWGELDYLLVDLPPGTGDAQLTIIQATPVIGAVIVTTPQDVALLDSRKGLAMFTNANIPVLGIVENMSYFMGDDGKRYEIFGSGGGKNAAETLNVPFLGEVPIETELRAGADAGQPAVTREDDSPARAVLMDVARRVVAEVCGLGIKASELSVSADSESLQDADKTAAAV